MVIDLSAKNKLQFINGLIDPPPATNQIFSLWKRCNNMVAS